MSRAAPRSAKADSSADFSRVAPHVGLLYPGLLLLLLFVVPLGIMVAVSFFARVPGGFFEPAWLLDNYRRATEAFFLRRIRFSLSISALAAVICVGVGFPFCYALSRLRRRQQVPWLVLLLAILSLSEVIIGFSWSLLLSRTAGLSQLLVWLGLLEQAQAWTPSFVAVLLGLVYLALPYTILVFYPPLSRFNPELPEAARSLGASPWQVFWTVLVPMMRPVILSAFLLVFIFVLGSYLIPQVLGRPQQWTVPVLIADQALFNSNIPLGAALAMLLLLTSVSVSLLAVWFNRRAS